VNATQIAGIEAEAELRGKRSVWSVGLTRK
jgi:hypothetical protein